MTISQVTLSILILCAGSSGAQTTRVTHANATARLKPAILTKKEDHNPTAKKQDIRNQHKAPGKVCKAYGRG